MLRKPTGPKKKVKKKASKKTPLTRPEAKRSPAQRQRNYTKAVMGRQRKRMMEKNPAEEARLAKVRESLAARLKPEQIVELKRLALIADENIGARQELESFARKHKMSMGELERALSQM